MSSVFHSGNGDIWDLDTGEVIEDNPQDHAPCDEHGGRHCELCERPWPCPRSQEKTANGRQGAGHPPRPGAHIPPDQENSTT